jgi:peptidylprolyl isomerase
LGTPPYPIEGLPVRLSRSRALALLILPAVLLTACGSGDDGDPALKPVTVKGEMGKKPTIEVKKNFKVEKTSTRVVNEGDGATVKKGQRVTVDYVLVNGRDGKELQSTFGAQKASFVADEKKFLPGLVKGVLGKKVGSRVLVGIPPTDGLGSQGNPQLGVQGTDTLLFVVDVDSARTPLTKATGKAVAPKAGLPTVAGADKGKPTITVPKTKAPTALVSQLLVKGTGPEVKTGQQLTVHYTGVFWNDGKEFDSSFKTGQPATFPIGTGGVIKGWDQGLVGQTVGSRVLLVVPPALGYGAAGREGIPKNSTLVFVVDILDAG